MIPSRPDPTPPLTQQAHQNPPGGPQQDPYGQAPYGQGHSGQGHSGQGPYPGQPQPGAPGQPGAWQQGQPQPDQQPGAAPPPAQPPGQDSNQTYAAGWTAPQDPLGRAARDEPDWDALAARNDARARRRRLLVIGGGVLAAAALAGLVAVAITRSSDDTTQAEPTPAPTAPATEDDLPEPEFPEVTQPPPPNPLSYISSAEKDTAPLTLRTLFPGKGMSIGDRSYDKAGTADTTDCAAPTQGGLGAVLDSNGCTRLLRATYLRGDVAVTVGVAVFDTKADADKARKQAKGNIAALSGHGVDTFCRPVACWRTSNAVGRYAYFTIAGPSDGTAASSDDGTQRAGRDAGRLAFNQLVQRGKDAATKAAQ